MKTLEEEEVWGREKEFTLGPLKFEVIIREPSEDIRVAFREG